MCATLHVLPSYDSPYSFYSTAIDALCPGYYWTAIPIILVSTLVLQLWKVDAEHVLLDTSGSLIHGNNLPGNGIALHRFDCMHIEAVEWPVLSPDDWVIKLINCLFRESLESRQCQLTLDYAEFRPSYSSLSLLEGEEGDVRPVLIGREMFRPCLARPPISPPIHHLPSTSSKRAGIESTPSTLG